MYSHQKERAVREELLLLRESAIQLYDKLQWMNNDNISIAVFKQPSSVEGGNFTAVQDGCWVDYVSMLTMSLIHVKQMYVFVSNLLLWLF